MYAPVAQSVHVTEPVVDLYLPVTHAVHGPPSGPLKPALHVHCVDEVHPMPLHDAPELAGHARHVVTSVAPDVAEYVPGTQTLHETLPVIVLYLPATHAVHGTPSGPLKPALHVHSVDAAQPLHDAPVLAGHARHVAAAVAPIVAEYVPARQFAHASELLVFLYVPAMQAMHGLPARFVRPLHLFLQE